MSTKTEEKLRERTRIEIINGCVQSIRELKHELSMNVDEGGRKLTKRRVREINDAIKYYANRIVLSA